MLRMSYSFCMECNRLELSPPVPEECTNCFTVGSFTRPIVIYVPAFRGVPRTPPGYTYRSEIERALEESFEETRDPEPKPASERTMERMIQTVAQRDECCGVCLDNVLLNQQCIETPCCHKLCHVECMEKTLTVIPCCPFCRWTAD